MLRGDRGHGPRPLLGAVRAPALVLAGAQDPATPPWHGAVIASGIPGARLRVIRGASHLANVSSAAEVTATLLAHLAGDRGNHAAVRSRAARERG